MGHATNPAVTALPSECGTGAAGQLSHEIRFGKKTNTIKYTLINIEKIETFRYEKKPIFKMDQTSGDNVKVDFGA